MFSAVEEGCRKLSPRIRYGLKKFMDDVASILCKRVVSLKLRGSLHKNCVRSALCYGVKYWAAKKEDKSSKLL